MSPCHSHNNVNNDNDKEEEDAAAAFQSIFRPLAKGCSDSAFIKKINANPGLFFVLFKQMIKFVWQTEKNVKFNKISIGIVRDKMIKLVIGIKKKYTAHRQ